MAALALLNLGSAALRQYPPPSAHEMAAALQGAASSPTTAAALLHQASDRRFSSLGWVQPTVCTGTGISGRSRVGCIIQGCSGASAALVTALVLPTLLGSRTQLRRPLLTVGNIGGLILWGAGIW